MTDTAAPTNDTVSIALSRADLGQIRDGLSCRAEDWEQTAIYHESGGMEGGEPLLECRNAEEARGIMAHYQDIIRKIDAAKARTEPAHGGCPTDDEMRVEIAITALQRIAAGCEKANAGQAPEDPADELGDDEILNYYAEAQHIAENAIADLTREDLQEAEPRPIESPPEAPSQIPEIIRQAADAYLPEIIQDAADESGEPGDDKCTQTALELGTALGRDPDEIRADIEHLRC